MVTLRNYDHLKLIPKALICQEVVYKVLWSIINHHGKLHFSKCVEHFKKATTHSLTDHFEFQEDEMRQFLDIKKGMFKGDADGYYQALQTYDESKEFSFNKQGGIQSSAQKSTSQQNGQRD